MASAVVPPQDFRRWPAELTARAWQEKLIFSAQVGRDVRVGRDAMSLEANTLREKIRKCEALARDPSTTPHERKAAQHKARELQLRLLLARWWRPKRPA